MVLVFFFLNTVFHLKKKISLLSGDTPVKCKSTMVHLIIELPRPVYHFPWSIWSFGDFEKWLDVISHCIIDFGTLGTSLRKFGTYLRKFGICNPWTTGDPSLPSHNSFVPLVTLKKWLEVTPHPIIDLKILGVS